MENPFLELGDKVEPAGQDLSDVREEAGLSANEAEEARHDMTGNSILKMPVISI